MKQTINFLAKNIFAGIIIFCTIFTWFRIVQAWTDGSKDLPTVTDADTLTASRWNDVIARVTHIYRNTWDSALEVDGWVYTPKICDESWSNCQDLSESAWWWTVMKWFIAGFSPYADSSTQLTLKWGSIEINGSVYTLASSVSINPATVYGWSFSADNWYYVYVDAPDSGDSISSWDIKVSDTAPSYSDSKIGFYHPSNADWRCITVVRAVDASNILKFKTAWWEYWLDNDITIFDHNSNYASWTEISAKVPALGAITINVYGAWHGPSATLSAGTPGSTSTKDLVWMDNNSTNGMWLGARGTVMTSDSGTIKVKEYTTWRMRLLGFRMPETMAR